MDKQELLNIFNNHYSQDITLEKINSEQGDLGECIDEFEDALKSRLNVVDDFGLQGIDKSTWEKYELKFTEDLFNFFLTKK